MEFTQAVLKEQYSLSETIKNSDEKTVIRYRHKSLGRSIIKINYKGNCDAYKALLNIKHANLPIIYNVQTDGEACEILEEYIEGVTVSDVLQTGTYNEKGVCYIASCLCDALTALHNLNIVHRDIKPENIIISNEGRVVLIDFDASRYYKPYKGNDTVILGTAGYAAPEQFGLSQTDYRSDIYAMGVLMNVMLTGDYPTRKLYKGKLSKVISKCIQVAPENRYSSAEELKRALI